MPPWRISAVRSSRAARVTFPGRRASAPSASPAPSRSTDRWAQRPFGPLLKKAERCRLGLLSRRRFPLLGRNTDTWTTSCLRTTPSPTASWTFGARRAARGWATCSAGTRSTKTSRWASAPRWPPSTSLRRLSKNKPQVASSCFELKFAASVTESSRALVLRLVQNATQNSLELLEDPKAAAVDEIAAKLGLRKVGCLFSPLDACASLAVRFSPFHTEIVLAAGLDFLRPDLRGHQDRDRPLHQKPGRVDLVGVRQVSFFFFFAFYFLMKVFPTLVKSHTCKIAIFWGVLANRTRTS